MLFSQKWKTFSVNLVGFALFLAIGHLFFFSAVATADTGNTPHHDVADHQQEKDHPECPQDIHQFTQSDSDFDIADCALLSDVSTVTPSTHEISPYTAKLVGRTTLLPQERKTVLLI